MIPDSFKAAISSLTPAEFGLYFFAFVVLFGCAGAMLDEIFFAPSRRRYGTKTPPDHKDTTP